jgi:hypothetical protein
LVVAAGFDAAVGLAASESFPVGPPPPLCANAGAAQATLNTTDASNTDSFFAGDDVIVLSSRINRIGGYSTAKRP